MEKTKLGISVGLFGALLYAVGLWGGYFLTIAAVAYVLIREESAWLKQTAVKALALTFLFPLVRLAIGVIPDLMELVDNVMNLFDKNFYVEIVNEIVTLLRNVVNIAEYVLFVLLGVLALGKKTVRLPLVDAAMEKHVN
jgi:uncharacterized membrane protein